MIVVLTDIYKRYSKSIVVETCLPRRCIVTPIVSLFVSMSLPGNGSIYHNILLPSALKPPERCLPWKGETYDASVYGKTVIASHGYRF